jgi:DNA-binding transcriptional ArsR family regulator
MAQKSNTLPKETGNDEIAMEFGKVLRVLTDPTRLRIYLLLRQGESCVCELAATLEIAENLVSHHLGALKRVKLVSSRRDPADARWVYYQLDVATLRYLSTQLSAFFDPTTIGTRSPVCGPATPLMPQRRVLTSEDNNVLTRGNET